MSFHLEKQPMTGDSSSRQRYISIDCSDVVSHSEKKQKKQNILSPSSLFCEYIYGFTQNPNILYTIHGGQTKPRCATFEEFQSKETFLKKVTSTQNDYRQNKTFVQMANRSEHLCSPSFLKHWWSTGSNYVHSVHIVIWTGTLHLLSIINIQYNPQHNTDGLMVLYKKKNKIK